MRTDYCLTNGATLGDLLTAVNTVRSLERNEKAYPILIAMRELLLSIGNDSPPDEPEGTEARIAALEDSFRALFLLWLSTTSFNVPSLETVTIEEAFTVLFSASATVEY